MRPHTDGHTPFRLDSAVVYIDTERKFKEKRLLQIMGLQLQGSADTGGTEVSEAHLKAIAKRVHVIQPQSGSPSSACAFAHLSYAMDWKTLLNSLQTCRGRVDERLATASL